MKLIPKTQFTLSELRQKTKLSGYKIKSKIVSFIDLGREEIRYWELIHIGTGKSLAGECVSPDKLEEFKTGYNLLAELKR